MEYAAEIGSEGGLTSEFYTSGPRTARTPARMVVSQSEKHGSYQDINLAIPSTARNTFGFSR
jgi:hypothetical protein